MACWCRRRKEYESQRIIWTGTLSPVSLRLGTVRKQCGLSFDGSSAHENWVVGETYIEGLDPTVLVSMEIILAKDSY